MALRAESNNRDENWTKTIAVGRESFVKEIKAKLAGKAVGRRIDNKECADIDVLREPAAAYGDDFGHEMGSLRPKNALLWNVYDESSTT